MRLPFINCIYLHSPIRLIFLPFVPRKCIVVKIVGQLNDIFVPWQMGISKIGWLNDLSKHLIFASIHLDNLGNADVFCLLD